MNGDAGTEILSGNRWRWSRLGGLGRIRHREFAMGVGEMSRQIDASAGPPALELK